MQGIHQAAFAGRVAILSRLVEEDPQRLNATLHPASRVDASTRSCTGVAEWSVGGCTSLMIAIIGRQLEAAERLLFLGADAGLEHDDTWTAAHWACNFDLASALAFLRCKGASLISWTLLVVAIEAGAADCLAFLLSQQGVDNAAGWNHPLDDGCVYGARTWWRCCCRRAPTPPSRTIRGTRLWPTRKNGIHSPKTGRKSKPANGSASTSLRMVSGRGPCGGCHAGARTHERNNS